MELPLGLCRDRWSIQLQFCEDVVNNRVVPRDGIAFASGNLVDTDSLKLVCDILFYATPEGEIGVMEQMTEQMNRGGINFDYTDVISIVNDIPALTGTDIPGANQASTQSVSRLCGMSEQTCRNLLMAFPNRAGNGVLGRYFSEGAQGEMTYQVTVNNLPLYPAGAIGDKGDAQLWDQLSQVWGIPYNVGMYQYSSETSMGNNVWAGGNQQSVSSHTINGYNQDLLRNFVGVPLQLTRDNVPGAGLAIGTAPVEININRTRTSETYQAIDFYVFGHVERSFSLQGGIVLLSGM